MKKIFIISVIILYAAVLQAQTNKKATFLSRNSISSEMAFNSGVYGVYCSGVCYYNGFYNTINYERILKKRENNKLKKSIDLGINTWSSFKGLKSSFLFPADFNLIYGNKHNFEMSFGLTYIYRVVNICNKDYYYLGLFFNIKPFCYRFISHDGGLFFKFIPYYLNFKSIDFLKKNLLYHNLTEYNCGTAISIGYTFKNKKNK